MPDIVQQQLAAAHFCAEIGKISALALAYKLHIFLCGQVFFGYVYRRRVGIIRDNPRFRQ